MHTLRENHNTGTQSCICSDHGATNLNKHNENCKRVDAFFVEACIPYRAIGKKQIT